MPLFGSHLSIAGGYHLAVRAASALEFDTVQIFTKNNNQWVGKPLVEADVALFQTAIAETGVRGPIAHDSYLINLATGDEALWRKSIEALVVELRRAAMLGIGHVVAHPGSHVGAGEEFGIERIAMGLDQVFSAASDIETTVALENTAGQGSNLGYRFEHLAEIRQRCAFPDRITFCLDTCHLHASGYPLAPKRKYLETMRTFDRLCGIDRLIAFHVNDSKREFGSRVDRHEHIGKGTIGAEPFGFLVNDRRFRKMPMILETAKETDPKTGLEWDALNLRTLRRLMRKIA